jgi:hypothetical protein
MKIISLKALAGAVMLLEVCGCAPMRPPVPPRSQLDIRALQTREYQTSDTKMVMKALLNVLQDEGFIVKNAVVDLGLITATKELQVQRLAPPVSGSVFMGGDAWSHGGGVGWGMGPGWGGGPRPPLSQHSTIEASVNVTEFGQQSRVRVNFEKKTVDDRGGALDVHQIDDPRYYQDFFSKVDKGIFLQREKL